MAEFIASGFWNAILVLLIVGLITGPIGTIIRKKQLLLGEAIRLVPTIITYFYIWQVRHGIWWLIFGIMCLIPLIITVFAVLFKGWAKKQPITEENLPNFVVGFNNTANLPKMLDAETRFDSCSSLPDKKLVFSHTLVNYVAGSTLTTEQMQNFRANLIRSIKTNQHFAQLRQSNITFIYKYMDKEQKGEIAVFEIIPSYYK